MVAGELIALVISFAAAVPLTWLVRRHAVKRGIMDIPNLRSSHTAAVPRGGGAAIVVTCVVAALVLTLLRQLELRVALALVFGGVVVGAVGYLDDAHGLAPLTRFFVHVVASSVAVAALWAAGPAGANAALLLMGVLWIVGMAWSINLFNFMDGIDGLAGSQAVFVASATGFLLLTSGTGAPLTELAFVTAGACLGFLVWNWPPARIFMGDVGSGFLGFWLAALALALHSDSSVSVWTSVVLNSAFIADASVTLAHRVARGAKWYEAHRSHAYQRLSRRWRSHAKVMWLLWAFNLGLVLPSAILALHFPAFGPAIAAAVLTIIAIAAVLAGAGRPDD